LYIVFRVYVVFSPIAGFAVLGFGQEVENYGQDFWGCYLESHVVEPKRKEKGAAGEGD
jgi:hypothetical protein